MARPRSIVPTKPDDARAQRSIDALRSGLLALIEHKTLEQISIKEITEAARLSYPTFFRRFASKQDLLEYIATEEVRGLLTLGTPETTRNRRGDTAMRDMCDYIQGRRQLWTTLLTGGATSAMRDEFMRISIDIANNRPRTNPWLPLDLAAAFVASGMFEIFAWWLRQPADYPIENIVTILDALITDTIGSRRNVALAPFQASDRDET